MLFKDKYYKKKCYVFNIYIIYRWKTNDLVIANLQALQWSAVCKNWKIISIAHNQIMKKMGSGTCFLVFYQLWCLYI